MSDISNLATVQRTARKATWGSIIAAIAFFVGAVFIVIDLYQSLQYLGLDRVEQVFCWPPHHYLYPWNWAYGFDYYLCRLGDALTASNTISTTLSILPIIDILALIGCGVVCLAIGRRNIRQVVFITGIILGAVSMLATIATVVCIPVVMKLQTWLINEYYNVFFSVLFLVFLILLALMAKSTSEKSLQRMRAASFIIVGTVVVGVGIFSCAPGWWFSRSLYSRVPFILFVNIGDIPLFIALFALMFALPNPPKVRNQPLFVASALSIAEGLVLLLFAGIITANIVYRYILYSQMGPPSGYFSISVIYYFVAGVYIVIVGVLGLVKVLGRSTSRLLVGLGIGLIVVQAVWLVDSSWSSRYIYMPIFLAVSVLYLVGAMIMRR